MSVLIKGLKMPKSCLLCAFGNEFGECCVNMEIEDESEMTHSCPLIPIPDHGDLIDRDALMFDTEERYCTGCDSYRGSRCRACWVDDMHGELVDAPVVIPAERSEDGKIH